MAANEWWRFWSGASWREWRSRRRPWTEYRTEAKRLDRELKQTESELSVTNAQLAEASQQVVWAEQVGPQAVPIRTAKAETGLAAVPGVALLETRRQEGKDVWVQVDRGTVYFTDRKAVFAGTKNVEFRFDKIIDQEITNNGLFVAVSNRKRAHMLAGPKEQLATLITASQAVAAGSAPTSPFAPKVSDLQAAIPDIEERVRSLNESRAGLVAPPRPISPAWIPAGVLFLILAFGGSGEGLPAPEAAEATEGTTPTSTVAETTSTEATTSTIATTTSTVSTTTTTTLPPIPQADVVFAAPSAGASGDPTAQIESGAETATVTSITDGDTLQVRLSDGSTDRVRLIGINAPESNECFAEESSLVLSILAPVGSTVGLIVDVTDRDQFDRALRYIWLGAMSVNQEMVRRGAALVREYPPDTAMASALDEAQSVAQQDQLGLWHPTACGPTAGSNVAVMQIEADAPGNDNDNLNQEWVQIQNHDALGTDLTGWVLRDESSSNRYQFPAGFVLGAAPASVIIYTGCGDDSDTELYWCSNGAVWNNDGDTALLLDQHGNVVHSLAYVPPTTTTTSPPPTTATTSGGGGNCHPSYPDVCIPPPPPDLDCGEISYRRFTVVGSDPHGFDGDDDGIGCESG